MSRHRSRRYWAAAALLLAMPAASLAASPVSLAVAVPTADAGSAASRLKTLIDAEWAWRAEEFGRDEDPDAPGPLRFADVDPAAQQRRLTYWQRTLAGLDAIKVADLSPDDRVTAAVFRAVLENAVAEIRARDYEMAIGSGGSFWSWMAPRQPFRTAAHYRAYLSRLRDMPRYLAQQTANLEAGLARGFTPPRVTIEGRDRTIEPFIDADLARNPFYAPFGALPASIPAVEQAALRRDGEAAIRERVIPAFTKLRAFVRDRYIPGARTTLAAEALPDGRAYYAAQVKGFTTLDLTPDQIHAIGLAEVARIDADMQRTMRASGWTGTFSAFLEFLRTDPQFYAKTPDDLIARASHIAKKVDGRLKDAFGLLPRYRFTILATPPSVAPFGTGGNGGLDACLINTYNLPSRPLYTLPALVLHECAPGHSMQAALALEGVDRPAIRKHTYFSGYGEGWGLYTEWLGTSMGVYGTPYEEFGRQTYEMWRAVRLVVDTGIHHKGWSRQQAIDYLSRHTALSRHEVTTEVDRYISTPGQALAYKLGELTIRRKRADAEAKLGARFDQRWFHDVVLALGAVPLPVLESEIDRWIAAGGPDPHAAGPAA